MPTNDKPSRAAALAAVLLWLPPAAGHASEPPVAHQALDDAWWTGPLLAAGANTLPKGHVLFEPYFFDVRAYGRFDRQGHRRKAANDDSFGSQSYLLYGLTDDVTVGLIPRFGYRSLRDGSSSSGVQLGDLTLQGQYRLTKWRPDHRIPTVALVVGETLPTGRFDRLEERPNDNFGSGAWATTFGVYSQTYLWTPNGRILRARLDLSYTLPGRAHPQGESVYGTPSGFSGYADPARAFTADFGFEYSLTRRWVLALDLAYEHDTAVRVAGRVTPPAGGAPTGFRAGYGSSEAFMVAPAVEYNLSAQVGVIAGARIIAAGRNTTATVTPAVAVNVVL